MDSPSTSNKARAPAPSNDPINHSTGTAFPFLLLPAELRNRIYRLVLSNNTIHVEGTRANIENKYQLVFKSCKATTIDYSPLDNLSAAPDRQITPTSADYTKWAPCDSDLFDIGEAFCPHDSGVNLDVQLLRVCRQIHSEAALIPYAENRFLFSSGVQSMLCDNLTKKFSLEQRHAIKTVAMLDSEASMQKLVQLTQLFPKLKKMWLQYDSYVTRFEEIAHKLFYTEGSCRLEVIMVITEEPGDEFEDQKAKFEEDLKPALSQALQKLDDVDCLVKWYPG